VALAACPQAHPDDIPRALRCVDARRRPAAQRLVTASRWMTGLAVADRLTGPRDALMRLLPLQTSADSRRRRALAAELGGGPEVSGPR
jgi:hypothetical protein